MEAQASERELLPLIGTEEATVDERGRVLLSKKKRDRLGDDFVLAIGVLGCLVAYPLATWIRHCNEILNRSSINQGRDQLTRLTMADAVDEMSCDSAGRFMIPAHLRAAAKIADRVKIIGLGDRVEFWPADEYAEFTKYPAEYNKGRRATYEAAYQLMQESNGG
ncbi:MAG: hypothetical protein JNM85_05865 [Chthonomonas sp.]|nr:hypothetical protein [Chthonomonas sp.]